MNNIIIEAMSNNKTLYIYTPEASKPTVGKYFSDRILDLLEIKKFKNFEKIQETETAIVFIEA